MSSNSINYPALNSKPNWDDLCNQLKKSKMCLSDNHNELEGDPILISLLMFHHRFAKATQIGRRKSDQQKMENKKNKPNNTHIPQVLRT